MRFSNLFADFVAMVTMVASRVANVVVKGQGVAACRSSQGKFSSSGNHRSSIVTIFTVVTAIAIGLLVFTLPLSSAHASGSGVAVNTSAFDAIAQASGIVQLTLFTLVFLSILSWAVGYGKWQELQQISGSNAPFIAKFEKSNSIEALYSNIEEYKRSAAARVFAAGYEEMKKIAESPLGESLRGSSKDQTGMVGLDNLERALRKAIDREITRMEARLTILATTGSTGPFIGLFGTVWGIMSSFHKIGQTGSASLAVVAPGISEALITTAIGLLAAIPAVMMYNHFISRVKKEENILNNVASDFLNMAKRNFFRE